MARVGSSPTQLLERTADGVLLYGLTPPRLATTAERAHEIARATLARLASVELDALILYDVDAEADRSPTRIRTPSPSGPENLGVLSKGQRILFTGEYGEEHRH